MEISEITQHPLKRFHSLRDYNSSSELISRASNLYTKDLLGVYQQEKKPFIGKIVHQLNYFWQKYTSRPTLEMAILPLNNGFSRTKWGRKAETSVYETVWRFHLIIFNHSEFEAYYPVLNFNMALPYFLRLSVLNRYVPILPNSQIIIEGEYRILEEKSTDYQITPVKLPTFIKQLKVLLEYENNRQRRFYSVFEVKNGLNYLSTYRPLGFVRS